MAKTLTLTVAARFSWCPGCRSRGMIQGVCKICGFINGGEKKPDEKPVKKVSRKKKVKPCTDK